jgi:prepilin-type processing-associated H-X9-DG protein
MTETSSASKASSPWPSPLKILAAVTVIFAVGVAIVVSGYKKAWEKMLRLDCQSNLRQISLRCREYAAEHDGRFPSTWVELNLVGDDANWAKLLRCPSTRHEIGIWTQVDLWSDYRLLPGRTTNDPPGRILALEPLGNHGSAGANVLFVDGGTQWWPVSRLLGTASEIAANNATK